MPMQKSLILASSAAATIAVTAGCASDMPRSSMPHRITGMAANSTFEDADLSGSKFENINLSGTRFHDINFSDVTFEAAQIGGATFRHIGPPPTADGQQPKQRPVTFEEATLADSIFRDVDLSGVQIINCNTDRMTIDGIPVADLLTAYRARAAKP